jgi:hypothetical protein
LTSSLRGLLRLRVERAADRRAREQAHHGLLRVREVVDELREIVFEQRFLRRLGIEERNRVVGADAVRAREPEVDVLAADVRGLDAELLGAILVLGERQRIDDVEHELALGRVRRELLEGLRHAGRVSPQRRQALRLLIREEQVEVDRLVDLLQHLARAGRQRVELVLREVDSQAAQQHVARHDGDYEREQHQHERRVADPLPRARAHWVNPPS